MYKNYLIIASKQDKAGINITTQLSQFQADNTKFSFYLVDDEIIYTENLDLEKISRYDFVIFASKHKSEKKEKTISIHAPGNWLSTSPQFGGVPGKFFKTSALFLKKTFEKLEENINKFYLKDYRLTLECTHHGPLIKQPCMFIEIGSTEFEWGDRRVGFVLAKTISDTIEEFEKNPYREVAIGIGGPHYCPNFNKIQLNSNVAISHIIPQYVLPLTEEMIKEAIFKTVEEDFEFVLLDWKGLGNSEQRRQVTDILDKLKIRYERVSSIRK